MTHVDDGELQALRRRAYGPDADIFGDPAALRRLRELEGKGRPVETGPEVADRDDAPAAPESAEARVPAEPAEPLEPAEQPPAATGDRPRLRLRRPRLIATLALVVVAAVVAGGVIAAHRSRGDGLHFAGRQVARLTVDRGYQIPLAISGMWGGGNAGVVAFQEFHGLRVVTDPSTGDAGSRADACLTIYTDKFTADLAGTGAALTPGLTYRGCAAGAFPATVQFRVDDELPAALRSAFPAGTPLQFVYDEPHHEIVVFADR